MSQKDIEEFTAYVETDEALQKALKGAVDATAAVVVAKAAGWEVTASEIRAAGQWQSMRSQWLESECAVANRRWEVGVGVFGSLVVLVLYIWWIGFEYYRR